MYEPPVGAVTGTWVSADSYAPAGDYISAEWPASSAYRPPVSNIAAYWAASAPYSPPYAIVSAVWSSDVILSPLGIAANEILDTVASVTQSQAVNYAGGILPVGVGGPSVYFKGSYLPPYGDHSFVATWEAAATYSPPLFVEAGWSEADAISVYPDSIGEPDLYSPGLIVSQAQTILSAGGIFNGASGRPGVTLDGDYIPSDGLIYASWSGANAYEYPGLMLLAAWSKESTTNRFVFPPGIPSSLVFGGVYAANKSSGIFPSGIAPHLSFGSAYSWNFHRFANAYGIPSAVYGAAYIQGGVKTVTPPGLSPGSVGAAQLVNTTANQSAAPYGIAPPAAGTHAVSPQSIRVTAIYGSLSGYPVVQFPPKPSGWLSGSIGYPVIEFKTKAVTAVGVSSYATGYATIRDLAQRAFHQSSAVTAIFGDVSVRLTTKRVIVGSWDSLSAGDWAIVRSNRRYILAPGINPGVPGSGEIHNKSPSIAPHSIAMPALGSPGVGWRNRAILPSGVGLPITQAPAPSVTKTPEIATLGVQAPAIGVASIWPAVRGVNQLGSDALRLGAATIEFTFKRIALEGRGVSAGLYGVARIEQSIRTISVAGGSYLSLGMPWASSAEQFAGPSGIPAPLMSLHSIGGTQYVGPDGFLSTRWLTRIVPEATEIYPKTISASYGTPVIELYTRRLLPPGATTYAEASMRWGVTKVANRRQVITLLEDQQSDLAPPSWSKWLLVQNRNKEIGAIGFLSGKTQAPAIENTGRPIFASGVPHPAVSEYYKAGSVTHGIRYMSAPGIDSASFSKWLTAYNNAAPVKPAGVAGSLFGAAGIVNTRRYYRASGADAFVAGYPFISHAVRGLEFESRYGIAPPVISLPSVYLWTRYVTPEPIADQPIAHPALDIVFRRITPRWTHQDLLGAPSVRNNTPELHAMGRSSEDIGVPSVRLEWVAIKPAGASQQLFGSSKIADTKRLISVAGRSLMSFGDKISVDRIGVAPVVTQNIDLRQFWMTEDGLWIERDEGYGISVLIPDMGKPDLSKGYLYPSSSNKWGDFMELGTPLVTANTVRVEPGYGELLVGSHAVSLKVRRLYADGITDAEIKVGVPRLSPHTVYSVLEVTDQALINHGMRRDQLHKVNSEAKFGNPKLTTYLGKINPVSILPEDPNGTWGSGRPSLYNKRRYISLSGSSMLRMGWVIVPGPQSVEVYDPPGLMLFGESAVSRPPYVGPLYVQPQGFLCSSTPSQSVDYFDRELKPFGFYSQALGASGSGSDLYMPQNLRVGPLRPTIPVGISASSYGAAWVSHRVRGVSAQGFDSLLSEYDYMNFNQRMRVTKTSVIKHPTQTIVALGMAAFASAASNVRHGTHYIRPDGNADQYRKGAF